MPDVQVIPELPYDDVGEASEWLCAAFGLRERLRIGNHRAQLVGGCCGIRPEHIRALADKLRDRPAPTAERSS